MRVLHVIDHLGLGGAQAVLLDLACGLKAAGVDCEVAAIHCRGLFARKLEKAGVGVHILAGSRWHPAFLVRFARLVRRLRPEVLHFHLQASNWLLKPLAAIVSNAPRVAHDHASADFRFRGFANLAVDAIAHVFSHQVVAVSPEVADFLARCEGIGEEKLALLPNGVDVARFHPPMPEERMRAREKLGLPQQAFVAGALGRLAPEKNLISLVRVARLCPWAEFVVGGEGPCRREIEAALQEAGSEARLKLLGRVDEREEFYHALDAFLLPSWFEGLPMVLLEAMASGLPVISSPLPGVRKALGEAGLYAPPSSPTSWAEAMETLRDSPQNRESVGLGARDRCLQSYDLRSGIATLLRLYEGLLFDARSR